jgi:hypothetical protein
VDARPERDDERQLDGDEVDAVELRKEETFQGGGWRRRMLHGPMIFTAPAGCQELKDLPSRVKARCPQGTVTEVAETARMGHAIRGSTKEPAAGAFP